LAKDIVYRLMKRAEIRRNAQDRKSVKNGEPDRISDLLEEAAVTIQALRHLCEEYEKDEQDLNDEIVYLRNRYT